jgi:hypothetical protein
MATGDQADVTARLRAVVPPSWFVPGLDATLTALLAAGGYVGALCYALIAFASLQLRIATASGGWLDMISFDFLARTLVRGALDDAAFAAAIKRRILRQGGTRAGIAAELQTLTGNAPTIVEGFMPGDCGALGGGPVAIGYGAAGAWGTSRPAQVFIKVAPGAAAAADIYATVSDMTAAGVAAWVAIS